MLACHNVGMAFDQDTTRQALRWDRIAVLMAVEPVELEGSEGSEGSEAEGGRQTPLHGLDARSTTTLSLPRIRASAPLSHGAERPLGTKACTAASGSSCRRGSCGRCSHRRMTSENAKPWRT